MTRPLRIERTGGWYHVTARGNERKAIFRDDRDRRHFCDLLRESVERFQVRLHAFVLMDNHYHLLLELTEPNLSRLGQWLNLSYTLWFNFRHGRSGHLFQGRFKSIVVDPVGWGVELSRYLHLNPVRMKRLGLGKVERQVQRAGLGGKPDRQRVKERIERLRAYRWSSYRAYVGLSAPPEWLECSAVLELGGGRPEDRRRQYRQYVESAAREGLAKSPWEKVLDDAVLGEKEFLKELRNYVKGNAREQRGAKRLAEERPALSTIIGAVERAKRARWNDFRDRHGDNGRDMVLYLGQRVGGLKLKELAEATGLADYGAVSMAIRRFATRARRDHRTGEEIRQVARLLNC